MKSGREATAITAGAGEGDASSISIERSLKLSHSGSGAICRDIGDVLALRAAHVRSYSNALKLSSRALHGSLGLKAPPGASRGE